MRALVTIVDDDGRKHKPYEITPFEEQNDGIRTKYLFAFEYNKLNETETGSWRVTSET